MSIAAYIPGTYAWKRRREGILCQRTHEKLQQIVDGEIGPARAEQVLAKHLDACKSCDADAQVIRDLKVAIARVSSKADAQLVGRLEDLAKQLCDQHRNNPGSDAVPPA
jgi:anti-sigma factor RsiW